MATLTELRKKIEEFTNNKQFEKLIQLLTDETIEKFKSENARVELLSAKAHSFYSINQYDKAIDEYSKAISLQPDNPDLYYHRAYNFHSKHDEAKALVDYNKAIELNDKKLSFYVFRAITHQELGNYQESILDCEKAITLNSKYDYTYAVRGRTFQLMGEKEKAISDFSTAIKFDPEDSYYYSQRGNIYYAEGDLNLAIEDYTKALELDESRIWVKTRLDEVKAKAGKIKDVKTPLESESETKLYYLIEVVDSLKISESEREELKEMGNEFLQIIDKIIDYAFANNSESVVHYTKLKVADILVSNSNEPPLRYYNVVYMNDPEEGKILFECFNDKSIEKSFKAAKQEEDNNIFLGSFLPASVDKKNNHEDELIMWRTYGKDELKNEASGCSIVIKHDFFGQEKHYIYEEMNKGKHKKGEGIIKEKEPGTIASQALYSVLYYDKRQKKFVGSKRKSLNADIEKLNTVLRKFISLKDTMRGRKIETDKNRAINNIIYRFLSEIRYLFKSADYAFENELRVIQYATPKQDAKDNIVKIDDNGGGWLPKRLYIESNKPIRPFITKIILGPKVSNPHQWMYLQASMSMKGYQIDLKASECKFQ